MCCLITQQQHTAHSFQTRLSPCDGRLVPGSKALPPAPSPRSLPMQKKEPEHILADVRRGARTTVRPMLSASPAKVSHAAACMSIRHSSFLQPPAATQSRLCESQLASFQRRSTALKGDRPHATSFCVQNRPPGAIPPLRPQHTPSTHQAASASCLPHTPSPSLLPLRHVGS